MDSRQLRNLIVLTGPTGSGKTSLGIELANQMNAEIVSMDSMALYRGMDIGTAKPSLSERGQIPHHLIDVLDPWESASVAWWLKEALACCRGIQERENQVLFVGGTPLYLKALLRGLFDGPHRDETVRERLGKEAEMKGGRHLHDRLAEVDPKTAGRLHPNDLRRVIRALEVWELTGRPISSWQEQWADRDEFLKPALDSEPIGDRPKVFWLDIPRTELYVRINARVLKMLKDGLIDEVNALLKLKNPLSREAAQAVGYKEIIDHIEGRTGLDETILNIQTRSRNLAKRQITWFRHLPEAKPVNRQLTFSSLGLKIGECEPGV